MTTINRTKFILPALVLCILAASGAVTASLQVDRVSSIYSYSSANTGWGKAVAVGPEGNVYVAGDFFGGATYDIRVSRLNGATMAQSWGTTYNPGNQNYVSGILADSSYVYVCGRGYTGATDGFLAAFRVSDGLPVWNMGQARDEGYQGMCLDPSEGVILVVGSVTGQAVLNRMSKSGSVLDQTTFQHPSYSSYARAICATKDRIFVAGNADNGTAYPWVYCLDRETKAKVYSKIFTGWGNKGVVSVTPVGEYLCALITDEFGGTGILVLLNSAGEEVKRAGIYNGYNCAVCASPNPYPPPQQVVAHPTLPVLFVVSGFQRNILSVFDLDFTLLLTQSAIVPSEGASTMEWVSGVAVSSGLNSAVYAVGQQKLAGPIYKIKAGGFTLGNSAITGEQLVVAPNRLELGGKLREVSFIVRGSENKEVSVQVFDAGGRVVKTIKGTTNSKGVFEARWDGTGGTSGVRLAPGLYWVRKDGENAVKPLMITTEVK